MSPPKQAEPRVRVCSGADIAPWLPAVAELRIEVFREWPYLYEGDTAYECGYLERYARSEDSLLVLVTVGERVVGASTGVPMADETEVFRQPLVDAGIDPATVFYCGESVLLPEFRGRGFGHRFFDEREAHARRGGFACTAFCAVDRSADDARRPAAYRGNDIFWMKRGYCRQAHLRARMSWPEVGGAGEVEHELTFWTRALESP